MIVATPSAPLPASHSVLFTEPKLRAELEHIGVNNIADIESRLVGRKRSVDPLLLSYGVPANSDYFPYVDLNAPRLRFMQRDAVELPSTLVLPLPLVAMLNARPGASRQVDSSPGRRSDDYAKDALAIGAALGSGSLQGLDAATASAVFAIRMNAVTCALPGADTIWRTAVHVIADATASYLTRQDLERVWSTIEASACSQHASAESRSWLALLRAVALRDAPTMQVAGESIMHSPAMVHDPDDLAYSVSAAALGALSGGHASEAETLLDQYSANNVVPRLYQLSIRWLRACAASRSCVDH